MAIRGGFLCSLACLLSSIAVTAALGRQGDALDKLRKGATVTSSSDFGTFAFSDLTSRLYADSGSKENDRIVELPGQPAGVDFVQYGGYVTVDDRSGRALFYYFAEAAGKQSSSKPLLLWLNGGPGCSSFGIGAMQELGPFRVMSDGRTLYRNPYAWNSGKFPEYKGRDFYIAGESYAGHYVPQLAYTILQNKNQSAAGAAINLKGIAIGNAVINDETDSRGIYDFFWTHALISDATVEAIHKYCNFSPNAVKEPPQCLDPAREADQVFEELDIYNIYAPLCFSSNLTSPPKKPSIEDFDPCTSIYVNAYLNDPEVQKALHANITRLNYSWSSCSRVISNWVDSPSTILPIIQQILAHGVQLLVYSGDTDGRVPVTSTRYSLNVLNLPIKSPWRSWTINSEVGGYTMVYDRNLTFATVRGAGHEVPSYQPARALVLIDSFLHGLQLPA
ncbi:unnamed protein product [Musa hybrid cultivar]